MKQTGEKKEEKYFQYIENAMCVSFSESVNKH